MEYIHGLSTQGRMFLFSLGFGFLLGVLYDFFRLLRLLVFRSKSFTFFSDFLYFLICTLLTFFFLLVLDAGRIRLYSLGGELVGFLVYYFSVGTIAGRFCNRLSKGINRVFGIIFIPLKFLLKKIKKLTALMRNILKKIFKKFKKKQKLSCQTGT